MKLLIKNGVIATPEKTYKADILAEKGVIANIGENLSAEDAEVVDADGKYVFAGGVDVHTHLNLALGDRHVSDGFYHGTLAAAFGGTTTIVDHPEAGSKGCSLHAQPEMYKEKLATEAVVDYGVHGVFQRVDKKILSEVPELINDGIPSMKVYTTYANMLENPEIKTVLDVMDKNHGLTAFHAEDNCTIAFLRAKYGKDGKLSPIYHALSRPDVSESVAIAEILELAENAPVYIVHLSTAKGLSDIKLAKLNGQKVYAETCPQYLLLTDEKYRQPDGIKYIMAPPLRKAEDCDALWKGLADGTIDIVATDHCSFSYADKMKFGQKDFRQAPGGCPGVETRIPLLYSEGVAKGRISINRFTELISVNPAKLMGMYPKKGAIEIGSDADFFILDGNVSGTLTAETLHQKCDYTPFEGTEVTGIITATILRGKVIVSDGEFKGEKGGGEFIHRKPFNKEEVI